MLKIAATLLLLLTIFVLLLTIFAPELNVTIDEIYNSHCSNEMCAKKKNFVFGLSVNVNANVPPFLNEIRTYLIDLHTEASSAWVRWFDSQQGP